MLSCILYDKCSWCNKYKSDALKIKLKCKYQNKKICERCYTINYLHKSKIPFSHRFDLFN